MGQGGDCLFQPTLADVAPRANHVGDQVNVQSHTVSSIILLADLVRLNEFVLFFGGDLVAPFRDKHR